MISAPMDTSSAVRRDQRIAHSRQAGRSGEAAKSEAWVEGHTILSPRGATQTSVCTRQAIAGVLKIAPCFSHNLFVARASSTRQCRVPVVPPRRGWACFGLHTQPSGLAAVAACASRWANLSSRLTALGMSAELNPFPPYGLFVAMATPKTARYMPPRPNPIFFRVDKPRAGLVH